MRRAAAAAGAAACWGAKGATPWCWVLQVSVQSQWQAPVGAACKNYITIIIIIIIVIITIITFKVTRVNQQTANAVEGTEAM